MPTPHFCKKIFFVSYYYLYAEIILCFWYQNFKHEPVYILLNFCCYFISSVMPLSAISENIFLTSLKRLIWKLSLIQIIFILNIWHVNTSQSRIIAKDISLILNIDKFFHICNHLHRLVCVRICDIILRHYGIVLICIELWYKTIGESTFW